MCQDLNLSNDSINESNYKILCGLYTRYIVLIKNIVENVLEDPIADKKVNELDHIIREVDKHPIQWSFYDKQSTKFVHDFESIVVFKTDLISIC